jgi:hypothetical protein
MMWLVAFCGALCVCDVRAFVHGFRVRYVRAFTLQEILNSNNTISSIMNNINNNNLDPRLTLKRKDLLCNVLWLSDPHNAWGRRGVCGSKFDSVRVRAKRCDD